MQGYRPENFGILRNAVGKRVRALRYTALLIGENKKLFNAQKGNNSTSSKIKTRRPISIRQDSGFWSVFGDRAHLFLTGGCCVGTIPPLGSPLFDEPWKLTKPKRALLKFNPSYS